MTVTKYCIIPLTKGYVAIIDRDDYRRVNKYSWHVHFSKGSKKKHSEPYARTTIKGTKVYLHRFITGAEKGMHPDHKNHQTLDNRKENLEIVDFNENMKRRRKPIKLEPKYVNTMVDVTNSGPMHVSQPLLARGGR